MIEAPKSMIHGVKFLEWHLKVLIDLPVFAKEQDGKESGDGIWLNSLYKCSNCSLLNGDVSVMVVNLHALVISLLQPFMRTQHLL